MSITADAEKPIDPKNKSPGAKTGILLELNLHTIQLIYTGTLMNKGLNYLIRLK